MRLSDLEAIFRALNQAEVKYLVVGGLAVISHGYVRATVDVDLVLNLEEKNVLRAMKALTEIGYQPLVPVKASDFADSEKRKTWQQEKHMIVFQMRSSDPESPRIDLFVEEPFPFDEEYAKARWEDAGGGVEVAVLGLNRLLQMKRESGRLQDLADIDQLQLIEENRPKKE
jgi:hypothetical protein